MFLEYFGNLINNGVSLADSIKKLSGTTPYEDTKEVVNKVLDDQLVIEKKKSDIRDLQKSSIPLDLKSMGFIAIVVALIAWAFRGVPSSYTRSSSKSFLNSLMGRSYNSHYK